MNKNWRVVQYASAGTRYVDPTWAVEERDTPNGEVKARVNFGPDGKENAQKYRDYQELKVQGNRTKAKWLKDILKSDFHATRRHRGRD